MLRPWASAAGGRGGGAGPPWIFKHGTNIVIRGLKMLFFGLFCYFSVFFFVTPPPPHWKRQIVLFFWYFLLIFSRFFVPRWNIFCRRPWLRPVSKQVQQPMSRIAMHFESNRMAWMKTCNNKISSILLFLFNQWDNAAAQIINYVRPFWLNLSFLHQNALKLQFYHLPKFGGQAPLLSKIEPHKSMPFQKIMKKQVKNT